ncbi:MAG TPA: 3D domain-containing protein [Candidatus Dormibacteraeota bacterium]
MGVAQGRLRLKGLFALGSIALALGYVVPTVGVAAGPGVPEVATLTASVDAPGPAGSLRRLGYADDARVFEGRLVTFSERLRTETGALPFATRKVTDAGLAAGTVTVEAPGAAGVHTLVFEDQLVDGAIVDSTLLGDSTVQPADRVLRIGSKAVIEPLPFDPTVNYQQAIAGSATSYCLTGRTATGTQAGPGSIAVDPTVIKLGSHLYVPGYGYGYAVDTGGAIKGTLIDVWLTCDAAVQWGRRQVTIYVLPN